MFVDRQRRLARQSAAGSDPDRGPAVHLRAAVAGRDTCCATSGCWRSPARTARRRPPSHARVDPRARADSTPGFLIGGVPVDFGVSARARPTAPFFVIEADEYDTAFCDKRSKFVHYRPRTAILNNLEYDHADIFPDLAAIETQFHHLVRTMPQRRPADRQRRRRDAGARARARLLERGRALRRRGRAGTGAGLDDRGRRRDQAWRRAAGRSGSVRAAGPPQPAERARRDRRRAPRRRAGRDEPRRARGVSRRQAAARAARHASTASRVYDDFAHHPTAIAATLEGLRRRVGRRASSPCSSRGRTR